MIRGVFQHYLKINITRIDFPYRQWKEGKLGSADIEDIIETFEELKIAHRKTGDLINSLDQRLCAIFPRSLAKPIYRRVTLEECTFLINRRFKIINPGRGEADQGRLVSVGKIYATIVLPNGQKKQRIAKNLRLVEDGE